MSVLVIRVKMLELAVITLAATRASAHRTTLASTVILLKPNVSMKSLAAMKECVKSPMMA